MGYEWVKKKSMAELLELKQDYTRIVNVDGRNLTVATQMMVITAIEDIVREINRREGR